MAIPQLISAPRGSRGGRDDSAVYDRRSNLVARERGAAIRDYKDRVSARCRHLRTLQERDALASIRCGEMHKNRRAQEPEAGVMKVRELIRLLENNGWIQIRQRGSHRHFQHPTKRGAVTVSGKLSADIPPGTLRSALKQAGLQ